MVFSGIVTQYLLRSHRGSWLSALVMVTVSSTVLLLLPPSVATTQQLMRVAYETKKIEDICKAFCTNQETALNPLRWV